jgi:hypothetical protein
MANNGGIMDFFAEIDRVTKELYHSSSMPGGVKDGIYTQERRYQSGFVEWVAFEDDKWPDGPIGRGRTEAEAIEDLIALAALILLEGMVL